MELNLEIRMSLRMVQSYQLLSKAKAVTNMVSTEFWAPAAERASDLKHWMSNDLMKKHLP